MNVYFKYPILSDILIAAIGVGIAFALVFKALLILPKEELLLSTTSDIANVAFTSAGFVLTFLTLLVSFKSSAKPIKKRKNQTQEGAYNESSLFNLFLDSDLYNETVRHLKNGVKQLILVAIVGYSLKLYSSNINANILFYFNVFGLIVISLVLWRSLLVLSGVLKIQNKETDESSS